MTSTMPNLTDGELREMMQRVSNWGRWGDDDELGTLNLITAQKRLSAASLVRSGNTYSFSRPLSKVRDDQNYAPIDYKMTAAHHRRYETAHDWVGIECHGYSVTHLDALSHCLFEGTVYNNRDFEDVWSFDGMKFGSVMAQSGGVFTRGVLLDVAEARGVPHLEANQFIFVEDLERAEERAGIRVEAGDALFVHMGLARHERANGGPLPIAPRAGLHAECVEWMHERGVALFGGDCCERLPYPSSTVQMPLHFIGLVYMGLTLMDWPDVDALLEACTAEDSYEFLMTCAPLKIPGGTGSAVNPLAIF